MIESKKQELIRTISEREKLRPLGRISRLFKDPLRAAPYYALAALGHVRPFPVVFTTPWGSRMKCYLPEGNTFFYYGYCEANLTNFLIRATRPGMTAIDVGAHIGFYTGLFSELAGDSGSVHSFEPTPWTCGLLSSNAAGLPNVTVNNRAVSDAAGMLSFADYGAGYGAYNSAHPAGATGISRKPSMTTVQAVTLDAYCAENGIRPDIVKIDAEGFEASVLKGMTRILADGGPRPIVTIEVAGGSAWEKNRAEAFDILIKASYRPYEISVDGLLKRHPIRKSYAYDNLVFMPDEQWGSFPSLMQDQTSYDTREP